jgi:hypothetical protein
LALGFLTITCFVILLFSYYIIYLDKTNRKSAHNNESVNYHFKIIFLKIKAKIADIIFFQMNFEIEQKGVLEQKNQASARSKRVR